MFRLFCCSSSSATKDAKPVIAQQIIEINKSKSEFSIGSSESKAKLVRLAYETQSMALEDKDLTMGGSTRAAETGYTIETNLFTLNTKFTLTLVFELSAEEIEESKKEKVKSDRCPKFTNRLTNREVVVERFDQSTDKVVEKIERNTNEYTYSIMDKSLEEYLQDYRHLNNVDGFLELYGKANKAIVKDTPMSLNTFIFRL